MLPSLIDRTKIPHKPGAYIFKNKSGRVIYVGKAIDLYHRVASYFSGYTPGVSTEFHTRSGNSKTDVLVTQVVSVDTIIVESELEALILEADLIKKYLPVFNVSLRDDKDYLYIIITKEEYPKVLTARKAQLKGTLKYFGPFPSSRTVRETLKSLRKVFPWCSLNYHTRSVRSKPDQEWKHKACFYYHLGFCPGACVGKISKENYRKIIRRLIMLLDGKKEKLIDELTHDMNEAAKNQDYEEAGRIKNMIEGITYLTQPNRVPLYLENPNFLEYEKEKALEMLQVALRLPKLPERIECYDISNIQGREATGSMVVLTNGEIDKGEYRKFKIHISGRPNDVGMHREMIKRRLKHLDWQTPDLIIVDGGLGQARGVKYEVRSMKYDIPVYGLAKRMEWLHSPDGSVVKLPKSHPASKLLQKIRDEAHRFAISYHRKLHRKAAFDMIKVKIL